MSERGGQIDLFADVNVKQPDELSFVDEDIQELFEGCSYIMGMPLMAQLIKELRLLRQGTESVFA